MLLIASGQTKSASKLLVRPGPPLWKKLIFEPPFLFGKLPLPGETVAVSRAVTVPGTTRPVPGRTGYQVPAPCSRSPDGREHGLNPGPRSPGDQVGRVYSRAPGDLVNGGTVLDTWYRGTKPVSAGVSYLVPWALKHGVRY